MPVALPTPLPIENGSNRHLDRNQLGGSLTFAKVCAAVLVISVAFGAKTARADSEDGGRQFIGFNKPGDFQEAPSSDPRQKILLSPEIHARIEFTEAIVSWNAQMPAQSTLTVEARALYSDSATKYYSLGVWTSESAEHPRHSVANQADQDGKVSTDTLILRRPARGFQVRLTLEGETASPKALKFIGVCLCQSNAALAARTPNRSVWGKTLAVPERSQMPYPNGKVWCSPTTVSMLMGFWSKCLQRPELDRTVPAVADAVYDSEWKGTGNWVFNMAYAGSFEGMRAYVTRLSDVSEIEAWIARGIPVGLSLDYDRLRGKGPGPNGHLVVCAGFTAEGDPIINDPGTTKHVQKVFRRPNLIDAWSCSRNTVYLVYPEGLATPDDPFGHWDSPTTRDLTEQRR
jgi:peptidase C39-like protein